MNSISTLPSGEGKTSGQNGVTSAIHQARSFGQSAQSQPFQLSASPLFGQRTLEATETPQHALFDSDPQQVDETELSAIPMGAEVNADIVTAQAHRSRLDARSVHMVPQPNAIGASEANASAQSQHLPSQSSTLAGLTDMTMAKHPIAATQIEAIVNQTQTASLPQFALAATGQTHANQPSLMASPSALTQGVEWASVKIDTSAGRWGEQMMQVLHDRVSLQAQQNMQEAKIRLDPPELGKLDLLVRVEGDRLSVQINANAVATREALIQVSERLRAELQNQNFVHVEVNVGSGDAQQQGSHSQRQHDTTIFSARESSFVESSIGQSEHWLNTQA